jgi:hypothetical protein
MAEPLQPSIWIECRLEQVPVSAGTTLYRWSTRPLADAEFVEGRVLSWGRIVRSLSDGMGQYDVGKASVLLNDADGLFRGLMETGSTTEWFDNREAAIKVLSEAGRHAALEPRLLFRGVLDNVQLQAGRRASIDLVDRIRPYLDVVLPQATFERTYVDTSVTPYVSVSGFPDIHKDLVGTPIPLVGGEFSDAGALDISGAPADKGMLPAIYVGQRQTINEATSLPAFLEPPTLSASVVGTPGTRTVAYGVTAWSGYGETVLSNVAVVTNAPNTLSGSNYVSLTWPIVVGATHYVVYGRTLLNPSRRLKVVTTNSYSDTGVDGESAPGPPLVNLAQVPGVDGSFFWDLYIICLGVVRIQSLYASGERPGIAPARELMTEDMYGVDFLLPDGPSWPHPDPWIEIGGMRLTGFYARGPRSYRHVVGEVTMAVNACGYEDVGDGSGNPINQAFPLLQLFLNEHLLKNRGTGYRDGDWGPLEEWDDGGVAILQTSKFADCQALTATRLGDSVGYTAAIYLRERTTVREFLQRFCQTFDAFLATNHHGQLYPVLIDDGASATVGRHYRERMEIADELPAPVIDHDATENKWIYQFDFDPDAGAFRGDAESLTDQPGIDALRGKVRERSIKQYYTRDAATARDVIGRRRLRNRHAPRTQEIPTNLLALEDENGDQILVTHRDGIGPNGYEQTPFLVVSHVVEPSSGRGSETRATLVGLDLSRLLATSFPPNIVEDASNIFEGNPGEPVEIR